MNFNEKKETNQIQQRKNKGIDNDLVVSTNSYQYNAINSLIS